MHIAHETIWNIINLTISDDIAGFKRLMQNKIIIEITPKIYCSL